MTLSLRDQIALIYTLTGSQRRTADFIGVSHQKIGRVLHAPEYGGFKPDSRALTNPEFVASVQTAFTIYSDVVRQQSEDDGLPFDPALPVYTRRLPLPVRRRVVDPKTGRVEYVPVFNSDGTPKTEPGLRALVDHAHWLTDDMRRRFVAFLNRRRIYHNLSFGSWVDLKSYFKAGEEYWKGQNRRGKYRSAIQEKHRQNLRSKLKRGDSYGFVYTPMTPLNFPREIIIRDYENKLQAKHFPASGDASAMIAAQVILQIDIHKDKRGSNGRNRAGKPASTKRKKKRT
jgi:hypothetical protein